MDPLSFHIGRFREQAFRDNWLPLLREARQLMQPVGAFPNDLWLLVRSLATAHVNRQSAQEALRQLHGINSHAENVWRDYYIAHRPDIDLRVNDLLQRYQAHQAHQERVNINAGPIPLLEVEERRAIRLAGPGVTAEYLSDPPAPPYSSLSSPRVSGSDSLPTPISPGLTLASPCRLSELPKKDRLSCISDKDRVYLLRRLQEELLQDESFNITKLSRTLAIEAPHRAERAWRGLMYRLPEARAILEGRKNSALLRAEDDVDAYSSSAEDSSDEEVHRLRSSRRPQGSSLCRRSARPSRYADYDSHPENSSDDEFPGDGEASDTTTRSRTRRLSTEQGRCAYTNCESRGDNGGLYTLGDMKALACLLIQHPELEAMGRINAGLFIEKNLGIRSVQAWTSGFSRRKHHVVALATQMKAEQRSTPTLDPPSTTSQALNPTPVTGLSNFPPTKRPRLS